MPNSYSYLLSLILLFTLPLLAISQDEKVIAFNDLGFQFTIPDEWEGKETESTYILTSENQTGFVTISTLPFADITELKKQINGGIKKGNGFLIYSVGLSPCGIVAGYSANEDNDIKLINTKTKSGIYTLKSHSATITKILFLSKNRLFTAAEENIIYYWEY